MHNHPIHFAFKTLRLRVKREAYPWLEQAAREVNTVWNWANATSFDAIRRTDSARKWMSGFDLCALSAGSSPYFAHVGAHTVQQVCIRYAVSRRAAKRAKLRWRKSGGSHRSLGWVPFKASDIKRTGAGVRFCGKQVRVFEASKLEGAEWRGGQFAQDAAGDWWLCLPVRIECDDDPAPSESVGIDLGLKDIATTSDGDKLEAGRWTQAAAEKLASAQRRGHKKRAKRLYRKIARQLRDALHKFSRKIVNEYQNIFIGDVSSAKLAKTKMAKSVLDSGWGMLKTQLAYKGQWAGRHVEVVNEAYTTRACSACGALSGPAGRTGLAVRVWTCAECGVQHNRDVNAARNILTRAEMPTSVCGNECHRQVTTRALEVPSSDLVSSFPLSGGNRES